jgi:UDP-N-acetylmuramate dehydrogenase
MKIQENIPLAPLTTMGVGGAARYFAEASTVEEVREAVAWARQRGLALFVLGAGSNLVVSDAGFPGLVLQPALRGVELSEGRGKARLSAAAGEPWDGVVERAVAGDLAGVECLSGIPGSVGATPVQNVGAYGQEVSNTIAEVEAIEIASGILAHFRSNACAFTYRGSRFNTSDAGRYVILRVTFELTPHGAPLVAYADLKKFFGPRQPSLAAVRQAVLEIRRRKGLLLEDGGDAPRSAGSFFKNPVLSAAAYRALAERIAAMGLEMPVYPALAAQHKVPAAWLVEQAGFPRGYVSGRVGLSPHHALALINRGGAHAAEIMALRDAIRRAVREKFGVELLTEPVMVGF